jgi:hypothetical protein
MPYGITPWGKNQKRYQKTVFTLILSVSKLTFPEIFIKKFQLLPSRHERVK